MLSSRGYYLPLDDLAGKDIHMNNIDYIQQRRNSKKQHLRIRLGILQMIHKPLVNLLFLPIIAGIVFLWIKKDLVFSIFDVPQILFPIYKYTILIMAILIPIICIFAVIEAIGNVTARKDEADLQDAFDRQELRNGCPVLMDKKRIKGSNVTMREFYSSIPMRIWIERQEDISDAMNIHFVEKLHYGGKSDGKRIVMYTAKGRKMASRGDLYDDEL